MGHVVLSVVPSRSLKLNERKKHLWRYIVIVYFQLPQLHIVGPCSYTGDGHYPTARDADHP